MIHRITLSNGRVLLVHEQSDGAIGIGPESETIENEMESYVCSLSPDGVLVMPNSGDAVNWLCDGLKKSEPNQRTFGDFAQTVLGKLVDNHQWDEPYTSLTPQYDPNGRLFDRLHKLWQGNAATAVAAMIIDKERQTPA